MKTNIIIIQDIINYIEDHLEDTLSLDSLSEEFHYSKYHLCKMFVSITSITLHSYIVKRRLSEAARLLVSTDVPIMDIALQSGYDTQQSFTTSFKVLYKCSPQAYRKKKVYHPYQLKYQFTQSTIPTGIHDEQILAIQTIQNGPMLLIGFQKCTRFGFLAIAQCWKKLHAKKQFISFRTDMDCLLGVNDYSTLEINETQTIFNYFAGAQVNKIDAIPKGMHTKKLKAKTYLVLHFKGKSKDSVQPLSEYIYKEYLPQSSYQLDEFARYDFIKYGEYIDANGESSLSYWIPIIIEKPENNAM